MRVFLGRTIHSVIVKASDREQAKEKAKAYGQGSVSVTYRSVRCTVVEPVGPDTWRARLIIKDFRPVVRY